MPSAEIKTIS